MWEWRFSGKQQQGEAQGEHHVKFKFIFRVERKAEVRLLWESGKEDSKCIRGIDRKRGVNSGENVTILCGGLGKRKWATIPKGRSGCKSLQTGALEALRGQGGRVGVSVSSLRRRGINSRCFQNGILKKK